MLEAIRYENGKLAIIDQLLLPLESKYIQVGSTEDGWNAIKKMQVRGAPAIAIVACLSLVVELNQKKFKSKDEFVDYVTNRMEYLLTSRPTAVNIKTAYEEICALMKLQKEEPSITVVEMKDRLIEHIEKMREKDVFVNKSIGSLGADFLLTVAHRPLKILTHCNTGSLATAGYGTALGVIRSLHEKHLLERVYCTETRPYNQGSRLTAYECVHDKLPATLICDSMVAALMKEQNIDAVVVGADRVTSNGDTANKIGTYQIAVTAKYHSVPFFVAAPTTSIDFSLMDGSSIPIECRSPSEIKAIQNVPLAPEIDCWNPAFDITPASLIQGIITEFGVHPPDHLSMLKPHF